jgi:acetyl esterase/lipase
MRAGLATAFAMFAASAGAAPLAEFMTQPAPTDIAYAQRDGQDLILHMFKPADWKTGEHRPAVIWIHGGAWVGGNPQGSLPFGRYLASRGAVSFVITYRKAKPDGPGVADCLADCRSAVRYVRAHAQELGVDPARIAVVGESAGGHLAAALGTLEGFDHPGDDTSVSGRPDAMVLYNPIVDLTEDDWIRYAVGGAALADKSSPRPSDASSVSQARALSPLIHVAPGQPSALVVHGRGDKVVRVEQAERFADAMKSAGNRCDLVLYGPEIGHAFAITGYKWPESVVVPAIREADKFLASLGWLKGAPTLTTSDPPAWQNR